MTAGSLSPWPGTPRVHIKRWLPATPERAFESFTDPRVLRRWWHPKDFVVLQLDFPAQVGADYHVRLRAPDGTVFAHTGTFLKVVPAAALAYTWRWIEGPMDPAETLVEVSFTPERDGVLIELSHSRFVNEAERDRHGGWFDAVDELERVIGRT